MTVSMVAPQLSRFDLWVHPISESDDDGDVLGFLKMLAQPLQATTNGTPLPDVISVSYGVCESNVSPTPRRARWPSASSRPRRRSASRPSSPPATPAPRRARAASRRTS